MTLNGWLQILAFLAAILAVTKPLGRFLTRVFNREKTWLDPVLRPIERMIYRATGVDERREMRWTEYAVAMLLFSVVSMLVLYLIQRAQQWLPWNPQRFAAVPQDLAFNTAASFTTNTNWQAYSGESTMSYLTQMAGLAYHNFVSRRRNETASATSGSIWSAVRCGSCCRSASSGPWPWCRRVWCRTCGRTTRCP
jgi:potassium-transporting ATPase potassium-binding subunit